MRVLLLALIVACAPLPGGSAAAQSVAVEQRTADARETLGVLFLESGALERITLQGFETSGEQIWQGWSGQPGFAEFSAEKREAIHAYLTSIYPADATADVLQHAPEVLDIYSARWAGLFDPEQQAQIRSFLRTDEGRSWLVHDAFDDGQEPHGQEHRPTEAEARAVDRFLRTSAGQAWTRPEVTRLVKEISERIITTRALPIRRMIMTRLCDILAEDCPAGFTTVE